MPSTKYACDLAAIREAAARIKGVVHRTPVMTSDTFDQLAGRQVYFKCENLQKVGAFKYRGATNAVLKLTDAQAARGVVTHSSGNHAQALALAARVRGVPAYIVMPRTAPAVKKAAVEGYGGIVTLCEPTLAAREETAARLVQEDRRDADPALRPPGRDRGPGHRRARTAGGRARPRRGGRPGRRRRADRGLVHRREGGEADDPRLRRGTARGRRRGALEGQRGSGCRRPRRTPSPTDCSPAPAN